MKKVEGRMQNVDALRRVRHFFCILPSAFFLVLVRAYQLVLSPAKNVLLGPAGYCRFQPNCSEYAAQAVKMHGAVHGSWLAARRVCRCHPWGAHGADPVPAVKVGMSRCDVPVRVQRTEQTTDTATSAKVAAAELRVSNVGIL